MVLWTAINARKKIKTEREFYRDHNRLILKKIKELENSIETRP
jgi:hypothetical protein